MMIGDDIAIAECAQLFIKEHWRIEYQGGTSSIETEIAEHGIVSAPEQLWYAASAAVGLPQWASIIPQHEIGNYRADFMVNPIGYFVNHPFNLFPDSLLFSLSRSLQCFVVEIDGFEWHDKTPEQAERDKGRERFIQQQGYKLFRYAAREVLRDPKKCVVDIEELVIKELRKACVQMTIQRPIRNAHYQSFEGVE